MAVLLTHILVPYVILTVAGWQFNWLTKRWIAIGMAGAAIPDLMKIQILLDDNVIESILGIPFSYAPISSLGGVLLIAGGITVFFETQRRRIFSFLLFGALSSLVVDGLRVFADGRSEFWLYPFSWWRPPTPSLYVTSDVRVLLTAILVSAVVFVLDRSNRMM
ncbi:MAG: hypothetical protein J07HQX50_00058 [Haloquadratum sp. J07HQX50]|nr:MAG: hypothetical protein J07HQX50_00058 [Haloquadratum sp. J07HQX50]